MRFKLMDKVILQSTSRLLSHLWGKQGEVVRVNYDTNSYRVRVKGGGIVDCRSSELCKPEVKDEEGVALRVFS